MQTNPFFLSVAMAVVAHCSCPSSQPKCGDISGQSSPLRPKVSRSSHASADGNFRYLKVLTKSNNLNSGSDVLALFKTEGTKWLPFRNRWNMMCFPKFSRFHLHCVDQKTDDIKMVEWVEASCIKQIGYHTKIASHLFSHQKFLLVGFPTVLMLGLPFEASAEACEADRFSILNMPLLFAIAMIGATVGGLLARQRRGELKRLNDQLRQINAALRRQAKIESYAPNLSYAPVGKIAETEVIVDPRKQQLITNLKAGKTYLRNQEPEKAFTEFNSALELAQSLGDPIEEKKAARGLGASLHRQGKYREAIKYHSMVLNISQRAGENSGNTEAYGAIADCYTELGDLEQAGKFYDKYIARLEGD